MVLRRILRIDCSAWRDAAGTLQTGVTVQSTRYEGRGRRIVQEVTNSADLDATYHYYYDGQSAIEIRNGSDLVLKQQVWANLIGGYIDELVQVAINGDPIDDPDFDPADPTITSGGTGRCRTPTTTSWASSTTPATSSNATNTPYGQRTVYISPGANDPLAMAPTTMSRRVELPGGGTSQPYGLNAFGHQGLMHDEATGLAYNRARILHPRLARFMQRDPLGYIDGPHLYQYVRSNPVRWLDPWGMKCGECTPGNYQILSNGTVKTPPGMEPGDLEDMMAKLQGIINAADRLHRNPFDEAGILQRWRDWIDEGFPEEWGQYAPDGFDLLDIPQTPWDMLKDQIMPAIDNYNQQRLKNWYNMWAVIEYRVCSCCCKDPVQGEWSGGKTERERVEDNFSGPNFSTAGRLEPRDGDIQQARNKIHQRIKNEAEKAKCN